MADFKVLPTVNGVAVSLVGHTHSYQPLDASLTSLALLGTAADKIAYTTGVDTWAEAALTSFARTLLDDANAAAAIATLGLDALYGRLAADNAWTANQAFTPGGSTGVGLSVTRNLTATSTDSPVMVVTQDHASDDQDALQVKQDGTGDILELNDGGTVVLRVLDGGRLDIAQIIRALTSNGLQLQDDGGNVVLHIPDGGNTLGIFTTDIETVQGGFRAVQLGTTGYLLLSNTSGTWLGDNIYNDGAWKYRITGPATLFQNSAGEYVFYTAASGPINTSPSAFNEVRITTVGNLGILTGTPFSNVASISSYPGRGIHVEAPTGERAVLILQGATLADIVMVHKNAGANVKTLVYRNISGVYSILAQSDDGSSALDLQVMSMSTGFVGFGMAATTRLGFKVGTSANDAAVGGVLYVDSAQHANSGTGETDLASYSVPANTLSTNNMSIFFKAWGTFPANGNTKTTKVKFGSSSWTIGNGSMGGAAGSWRINGTIVRTGAATQDVVIDATDGQGQLTRVTVSTAAETLSGAVTLKLTGQSNVASNDVVQEGFKVWFDDANT